MAVIYATPADVATFTNILITALPTNILAVISNAQTLIDHATINYIQDYYLNSTKTLIGDADILLAVKNATCAQIEYWINIGIDTDITNNGNIQNFSLGNFSLTFGENGGSPSMAVLAPRAERYLFLVGLMFRGVRRI